MGLMRYPFSEFQANFRQLVGAVDLRNQLYRDAAECHREYAHEEAAALLGMAEVAEEEAKRLAAELRTP